MAGDTPAHKEGQKNILIVEDEPALRRAMTLKLSQADMNIDNAGDGKEGLDMIENNKYDLVLLDFRLHLPVTVALDFACLTPSTGACADVAIRAGLPTWVPSPSPWFRPAGLPQLRPL